MPNDAILCKTLKTTASQLGNWLTSHEKDKISDFILERFRERYFTPIYAIEQRKLNGFLIMGVSCLTLEALESFKKGWISTERHAREAFEGFLERESRFSELRLVGPGFYENVRCGILHRGETLGGWKIWLVGSLFQPKTLTVNAALFHRRLEQVLLEYVSELKEADFRSPVWKKARRRLSNLVANC